MNLFPGNRAQKASFQHVDINNQGNPSCVSSPNIGEVDRRSRYKFIMKRVPGALCKNGKW